MKPSHPTPRVSVDPDNSQSAPGGSVSPPDLSTGPTIESEIASTSSDTLAHGSSSSLSITQCRALENLMNGQTISDAARAAGVGRTTIHRWMRDDAEFQAAYNAWQNDTAAAAQQHYGADRTGRARHCRRARRGRFQNGTDGAQIPGPAGPASAGADRSRSSTEGSEDREETRGDADVPRGFGRGVAGVRVLDLFDGRALKPPRSGGLMDNSRHYSPSVSLPSAGVPPCVGLIPCHTKLLTRHGRCLCPLRSAIRA
jgi:hypothetical protein